MAAALALATFASPASAKRKPPSEAAAFSKFVEGLRPEAESDGISRKTFDEAFRGVTFDSRIIAFTTAQPEFAKPIWQYLASAVSPSRVERGRAKLEAERSWLSKARQEYGVEEAVLMGIWGMETEFGAFEGSNNVIRSLASLAFVHFRGDYFKNELMSALSILEAGDIGPREMVGSWAGAMGQTQFMPSSFLEYAVDFDGGGRRDIWNNAPDAIGSTANYLAKHGWTRDLPWGFEVRLPDDFKLTADDSNIPATFAAFAERGVERADGEPMPKTGSTQLLIPAGLHGPVFLITNNFKTIKSYNNSTAYALGVALLGDAILGRPGLRANWPTHDRQLSPAEVRDLQTRLHKMGYDVGDIDGRAGDALRAAVRRYQESVGLAADGYATPALLKMIKARR